MADFEETKKAKLKKQKYLILAIVAVVAGIVITYLPMGGQKQPQNTKSTSIKNETRTAEGSNYEEILERRLTNILGKMEGVGSVSVMITTVGSNEKVLAQNMTNDSQRSEENDKSGTTRLTQTQSQSTQIVLQSGNVPYILSERRPEIGGVLILAEGADNPQIQGQLTEAVSRLLNVPVHKVSVVKKVK